MALLPRDPLHPKMVTNCSWVEWNCDSPAVRPGSFSSASPPRADEVLDLQEPVMDGLQLARAIELRGQPPY